MFDELTIGLHPLDADLAQRFQTPYSERGNCDCGSSMIWMLSAVPTISLIWDQAAEKRAAGLWPPVRRKIKMRRKASLGNICRRGSDPYTLSRPLYIDLKYYCAIIKKYFHFYVRRCYTQEMLDTTFSKGNHAQQRDLRRKRLVSLWMDLEQTARWIKQRRALSVSIQVRA